MANTKVGRFIKRMYGTQVTSHVRQLDDMKLIGGDEIKKVPKRQTQRNIFSKSVQDVRLAVHGDDFVCLSDDDGLKRKTWERLDSKIQTQYEHQSGEHVTRETTRPFQRKMKHTIQICLYETFFSSPKTD